MGECQAALTGGWLPFTAAPAALEQDCRTIGAPFAQHHENASRLPLAAWRPGQALVQSEGGAA